MSYTSDLGAKECNKGKEEGLENGAAGNKN